MCASEGLLLGQKDLNFFGRMYAVSAALRGSPTANLSAIWQVMGGTSSCDRRCGRYGPQRSSAARHRSPKRWLSALAAGP